MKKEIDIKKYNDLCDKVRSLILYSEAFRKKNIRREENVQDLCKIIHGDTIELINRIKSLEKLMNNFNEETKDDS